MNEEIKVELVEEPQEEILEQGKNFELVEEEDEDGNWVCLFLIGAAISAAGYAAGLSVPWIKKKLLERKVRRLKELKEELEKEKERLEMEVSDEYDDDIDGD